MYGKEYDVIFYSHNYLKIKENQNDCVVYEKHYTEALPGLKPLKIKDYTCVSWICMKNTTHCFWSPQPLTRIDSSHHKNRPGTYRQVLLHGSHSPFDYQGHCRFSWTYRRSFQDRCPQFVGYMADKISFQAISDNDAFLIHIIYPLVINIYFGKILAVCTVYLYSDLIGEIFVFKGANWKYYT